MRTNRVGYLVGEGFKNIKINFGMSLASIGIIIACFVVMGASVLFSSNIRSIVQDLQGANTVNVYLNQDTSQEDAEKTGEQLRAIENIEEVTFVAKAEALQKYKEICGSVFDGIKEKDNFLPDSYKITMKDLSQYDATIEQVKSIETVESTTEKSSSVEKLTKLNTVVTVLCIGVVIALLVLSLFILSNAIKSAMYSRRQEIIIMKSVGATNNFIRLPFLVEIFALGIISAIIAVGVLKFIYDQVIASVNFVFAFSALPFENFILLLSGLFVGITVLFCLFGGMLSIGRFMRKEGEEIINI